MSTPDKISRLYEAAQVAQPVPRPWYRADDLAELLRGDREFVALADPRTVMALVEVYRAAKNSGCGWTTRKDESWGNPLATAIKKVERLND